jgi:hypothetical protein
MHEKQHHQMSLGVAAHGISTAASACKIMLKQTCLLLQVFSVLLWLVHKQVSRRAGSRVVAVYISRARSVSVS